MSDDYIRKIGLATENEAKMGLFYFLAAEFSKRDEIGEERAGDLAGLVTDRIFGEQPQGHDRIEFARTNHELIESLAHEIRYREDLCRLLSGAAYNTCYARYLRAGGKRSMFSNPFLGYIRAARNLTSRTNRQIHIELHAEISALDSGILRPMDSMGGLGILRLLPYSPNEREFYNAVHEFAVRAGVQFGK